MVECELERGIILTVSSSWKKKKIVLLLDAGNYFNTFFERILKI